jgi:hypothetical protein
MVRKERHQFDAFNQTFLQLFPRLPSPLPVPATEHPESVTAPGGGPNVKREGGVAQQFFRAIRRKWLVFAAGEFVRQLPVRYYRWRQLRCNRSHRGTDRRDRQPDRRADILIFDADASLVLIQFREPQVPLDTSVFRQAATYNGPLRVPTSRPATGGRASWRRLILLRRLSVLDAVPEWRE